MTPDLSRDAGGPSAGPLPSRPAVPPGDRPTYPSGEGLQFDRTRWPQPLAQRHRALVGVDEAGAWHLLADREADLLLLQAAEARLGEALRWQRCSPAALDAWLAEGEQGGRALDAVDDLPDAAANDAAHAAEATDLTLAALTAASSPAVRLLDAVLLDALADGASDIHLEMQPRGAQLRLRIDGVMQAMRRVDGAALAEQLVSRLKVLAELDIGERRLPQDGRFKRRITVDGRSREIDFRLSIMPSVWGEDAVVRVLDRSAVTHGDNALTLAALGFDAAMRETLLQLARAPHGMLLVTGPTGSGKTTTLYAALAEIHSGREKIITIEDPVEYQLEGVVQIPVNEKKGLSFARGLRSILRHDPDRVMVGEIRDAETAQIAVQAALTGHLVFSSVHANNAFDVIGRFMHMGLDLYNVVAALNAVLGQRLMRQLCPACAAPVAATADELARLGEPAGAAVTLRRAVGCPACHHSGYRGRRAVAELLRLDDGLRDLIAARAPMSAIKQAARERGMQSLHAAALAAVRAGVTSFEEMDRVVVDA